MRRAVSASGWLLVVCMFLPTLRVCGDPVAPYQFPPSYGVYIGSALVAVIALAARPAQRTMCIVVIGLWGVTAVAIVALIAGAAQVALGLLAAVLGVGGLIVGLIKLARMAWSERVIATACLGHATLSCGWYCLLCVDSHRMWGAWVGLGASLAMVAVAAGWLAWCGDVAGRQRV